jgi:hypothetical protein
MIFIPVPHFPQLNGNELGIHRFGTNLETALSDSSTIFHLHDWGAHAQAEPIFARPSDLVSTHNKFGRLIVHLQTPDN